MTRCTTTRSAFTVALVALTALTGSSVAADVDLAVDVQPGGFVWAGQRFDDADHLAAAVLPRTPRSVALHACGGEAGPALQAAAHRLRWLELHLSVDVAGCASPMLASIAPAAAALPVVVDNATAAWWAQIGP